MTTRAASVTLKPHDPFDLIRLLARTQSDPRKALAELVQNSLDAGAAHIRVTWFSHQGARALSVWDDGRGVFPDMEREDALTRIATTIGHSHKRKLSPQERMREMTLGKYGIGLLGFWSVGHVMEIRTRVQGSDVWALTLEEDNKEATLARRRLPRLPLEDTFTEVVISAVHKGSEAQLKPRRLAAYLAGELRGQLLQRSVSLEIHDRVGRGRAPKRLIVRPQRYQGIPLEDVKELEIDGQAAARVELYLLPAGEERHGHVQLACGGTTVLDDLALLDGVDAPRAPWSSGRFEGVIDFPDLEVSPGTRRGFVPNAAAYALLAALPALEERLKEVLAEEEQRRAGEQQADDAKDLRRLFRRLAKALPEYALLDTRDREKPPKPDGDIAAGAAVDEEAGSPDVAEVEGAAPEPAPGAGFLFPPGPLAQVRVHPRRSVLPLLAERKLRATALDADGRPVLDEVEYAWSLEGPGSLDANGQSATYVAPQDNGQARVRVIARSGETSVEGAAEILVRDDIEGGGDLGVPDPLPIEAPNEPWRSRVLDGVWQYNSGHPDYRIVCGDDKLRLRYLAHCFAKEVVLRNFGNPVDSPLLERMVEVLTHLEEPAPRRKKNA